MTIAPARPRWRLAVSSLAIGGELAGDRRMTIAPTVPRWRSAASSLAIGSQPGRPGRMFHACCLLIETLGC
jgi:hypothetical protein